MTPEETHAMMALIESSRGRALAWLKDPNAKYEPLEDFINDLALDVLMLTTALKQARRLS